jgi:hypothetical protein
MDKKTLSDVCAAQEVLNRHLKKNVAQPDLAEQFEKLHSNDYQTFMALATYPIEYFMLRTATIMKKIPDKPDAAMKALSKSLDLILEECKNKSSLLELLKLINSPEYDDYRLHMTCANERIIYAYFYDGSRCNLKDIGALLTATSAIKGKKEPLWEKLSHQSPRH